MNTSELKILQNDNNSDFEMFPGLFELECCLSVLDIITIPCFITLMAYRLRVNEHYENRHNFLIFNQLYYISVVGFCINSIKRAAFLLAILLSDGTMFHALYVLMSASQIHFCIDLIHIMTVWLTFIAAVQKIIFVHAMKYHHLVVRGKMKVLIIFGYSFLLFYIYIDYYEDEDVWNEGAEWSTLNKVVWIYEISIFIMSIASGFIYFQLLKLISRLTNQLQTKCFLWQFMPISIHQMIYTAIHLTNFLLLQYDSNNASALYYASAIAFFHLVPLVITFSYISSKESIILLIDSVIDYAGSYIS